VTDSYQGPITVLGDDGVLLTTGRVNLEVDADGDSWQGVLEVLNHTAVAGKALVVTLVTPDGKRGRAQLIPASETDERSLSEVVGLGTDRPF
jgi:hypothetical protein